MSDVAEQTRALTQELAAWRQRRRDMAGQDWGLPERLYDVLASLLAAYDEQAKRVRELEGLLAAFRKGFAAEEDADG